jgi:hypothetical protein
VPRVALQRPSDARENQRVALSAKKARASALLSAVSVQAAAGNGGSAVRGGRVPLHTLAVPIRVPLRSAAATSEHARPAQEARPMLQPRDRVPRHLRSASARTQFRSVHETPHSARARRNALEAPITQVLDHAREPENMKRAAALLKQVNRMPRPHAGASIHVTNPVPVVDRSSLPPRFRNVPVHMLPASIQRRLVLGVSRAEAVDPLQEHTRHTLPLEQAQHRTQDRVVDARRRAGIATRDNIADGHWAFEESSGAGRVVAHDRLPARDDKLPTGAGGMSHGFADNQFNGVETDIRSGAAARRSTNQHFMGSADHDGEYPGAPHIRMRAAARGRSATGFGRMLREHVGNSNVPVAPSSRRERASSPVWSRAPRAEAHTNSHAQMKRLPHDVAEQGEGWN